MVPPVDAWHRYWFRPGGRTSAAVLRIAIGTSILWTLWRQSGFVSPATAPHDLYHPVGILRLLPGEPGEAFMTAAKVIAWGATLAMIAGVRARLACAVSFFATLVVISYVFAFQPTWSHNDNAPLIAQLAFLGAHGGDALAFDAWWRRRRGEEPAADRAYMWSVQLVQLALALIMANAVYNKLIAGGLALAWVRSDNLRNQILIRFDYHQWPRTAIASWLVGGPMRWKTAAALNCVSQLSPLAACFCTRRPVARAVLGSMFAVEVLGLDFVMGFQNFHWLPLTAAFYDWDALLRRRGTGAVRATPAARVFVIAFVLADVVIPFWHWPYLIDQRVNAYPISAYPMFASVRAVPPYREHLPYELFEVRVRLDPPASPDEQAWIDARTEVRVPRGCGPVRAELAKIAARFPHRTIRAELDVVQAAPYPAPARLERATIATIAELAGDGTLTCAIGEPDEPEFVLYRDGTSHALADDSGGRRGYVLAPRGAARWLVRAAR